MSESKTDVIDIEKIRIEENFNPRGGFDEKRLAELEASIRQSGVVTALTVRPNGESYVLIAGERRLIAAKRVGMTTVPVVIREGSDALAAAIAENLIREDLDPVEEARALARLAEVEKLATHKQLAERVGKSPAYVSERLRLLNLPEGPQEQIAQGKVPIAAEPNLRIATKVEPEIADFSRLVARGELDGRDLVERFDEVLYAVAESELPGGPTMVDVGRGVWLSQVVSDPEEHAQLAERWSAAAPYGNDKDPVIRFGEPEVDAARASGKLLEYESKRGEWTSTLAFLCDLELARDLAMRALERTEKEAAKRAKELAEERGQDPATADPATLKEQEREERRKQRDQAKKEAERARIANLELGRKLVARRGAKSRKDHSLGRALAVAEVILDQNENLAARGLGLVLPQLQEVEVKELKSGEKREKVTYRRPDQCVEYLRSRISEAKSANEVLELLADALIASVLADEREVPRSRRVPYWLRPEAAVKKLLNSEIKSLRARRKGGS